MSHVVIVEIGCQIQDAGFRTSSAEALAKADAFVFAVRRPPSAAGVNANRNVYLYETVLIKIFLCFFFSLSPASYPNSI